MDNETIAVMTLTSEWGDSYTCEWDLRHAVFSELENAMEDMVERAEPETWTVRVHTMARSDYEALPEFEGF